MSRESDDNFSSMTSTYTDMYQETVKNFTRSSLSPDLDRHSPSRSSMKSATPAASLKSAADHHASFDLYLEATGRRRSSDHGAVLTADTEQFIIGQKVWVAGIRPGQIAYIGETHFAPGDWAGVVLDEPNGKNDGCVAGKRYFQCEPKRGIFSRLTRLTLAPLPGAQTPTSPLPKLSPDRSRTVSPTASVRSSFLRSPGKNGLTVGDRVIVSSGFGSRPGILRYLGETKFAQGNWCGIELDEATGKNDGAVDGIRYFECKPKFGVFVPIAKVSLSPSSKKSRLSRTGSRESLTSIGTMNSIATTNTSRMRMNAQQRKSSLIKPVTSPKTQFSMQDLLREKQNHIEQLMIERDLDREDTQNQALQFQKNISELKGRIVHLERALEDERKKSEDLQFSIDEATFCGDETSVQRQVQVYKEKIGDLEKQLTASAAERTAQSATGADSSTTLASASAQIAALQQQLEQQAADHTTRLAELREEDKRHGESVALLRRENESLQRELVEKDSSLEKFSLSACGVENLRGELALLKADQESERAALQADYAGQLAERAAQVQRLDGELTTARATLATLEAERANAGDECEILRGECKARDTQLQQLNEQLAAAATQVSVQRAENATLDDMLKAQQQSGSQSEQTLAARDAELTALRAQLGGVEAAKAAMAAQLQVAEQQVQQLAAAQLQFEGSLKEATGAEQERAAAMQQLQAVVEQLRADVAATNAANTTLSAEVAAAREASAAARSAEEQLRADLVARAAAHEADTRELQTLREALAQKDALLADAQRDGAQALAAKAKEAGDLQAQLTAAQAAAQTLTGETSATVAQLNARIGELEAQLQRQRMEAEAAQRSAAEQRQQQQQLEHTLAERADELRAAGAALESTNGVLRNVQQMEEQSAAKCRDLEAHVKRSDDACAAHQLELGDLTRKCEALSGKCDSVVAQNDTLQRELLTARAATSELQEKLRTLNEASAAKQRAAVEQEASGQSERTRLEGRVDELQQQLTHAAAHGGELQESVRQSRAELAAKQQQLTALEEKTIKQELALSDGLRQLDNLQARYDALTSENDRLQADVTALRTTSTDSSAEVLKLSQMAADKQRAYEELLDRTGTERSDLERQLQASQQRVDALCGQVEALTHEQKTVSEESFKRYEQLKLAQEQAARQALELGDAARKLDTLGAKCGELEAQNAALHQQLDSGRSDSTRANGELLRLSNELAQKQKALQELSDKASADRLQLESQVQELTQQAQSAQSGAETLRTELQAAQQAHAAQLAAAEQAKTEALASAAAELERVRAHAAAEQRQLVDGFEAQMRDGEQTRAALDQALTSLQQQIKLLQDELGQSQRDFKAREQELCQRIAAFEAEKEQLRQTLQQLQQKDNSTLSELQQQNATLRVQLEGRAADVAQRTSELQAANAELAQHKQAATTVGDELSQLRGEHARLQTAHELSQDEVRHQGTLLAADQRKIDELKQLLDALQTSHANISATNAELSAALDVLEQEKDETSHIFELFEMESDQNVAQLIEKLTALKQELAVAQTALVDRDASLQTALAEGQSKELDLRTQLSEAQQANAELRQLNAEGQTQLQAHHELAAQLEEYKKIIDEMDDAGTAKLAQLEQLLRRVQELEGERAQCEDRTQSLQVECAGLQKRLEVMDLEKTRESVALQARINELQSVHRVRASETNANTVTATTTATANANGDGDDTTAQINFLNSIIADMQRKNETLKAKIEKLEALPFDFTQSKAFESIGKRKPAPRVFCDICDVFDQHETEDCPVQASDDRDHSPLPLEQKERKLPPPRKYCESCEVFGHEVGECDDECF